jgi:hypothetical protein
MNVNIGGNLFSINGGLNIGVANDISGGVDQYTVFAEKGIAGGLNDYLTLQLFLQDSTGTVFDDTSLVKLTQTYTVSSDITTFFLDGVQTLNGTTYQFQVQGNITNVPEPATVTLLGPSCWDGFLHITGKQKPERNLPENSPWQGGIETFQKNIT